jgi:putative ABC transport system permease protein
MKQTLLVFRLGIGSLRERAGSSLAIVISMACITAVLLATLSVASGMMQGALAAADPTRVIVLPSDMSREYSEKLEKSLIGTLLDAPGIAKGANGKPLGDAETNMAVPPEDRKPGQGYFRLRGVGPAGLELRPELKIVAGRWFQPGRQEIAVGAAVSRAYGLKVGGSIPMQDGRWPIVGVFSGNGVAESEFLADADTIMASTRRAGFGSVLVKLESPAAFDAFKRWLTTNPALHVSAETQESYNRRTTKDETAFFIAVAWLAGGIMSIGALFGAVNVMYAVVAARTREMGMLRALGYDAVPVATSVVLEMLALCVVGALIGAGLAWLLFDGHQIERSGTLYVTSVSAPLLALGVAWAVALALLGSLLPAIRAGRLPVVEALRVV